MRRELLCSTGLGLALLAGGDVAARRVVAIVPKCPPQAQELTVDFDGPTDMCLDTLAVTCSPGEALSTDQSGEQDLCGSGPGAKASSCPEGYQLKTRAGADQCVLAKAPLCPREYSLRVRPGDDACVY
jgi:hypothetical protein